MSGNTVIVRMDDPANTNTTTDNGSMTRITQQKSTGLREMFLLMFILFVGAITIVVFVYIYRLSPPLFTIIVCLYLIAYSLFVLFYTQRKRSYFEDEWEFKVIGYISLYTMFFAVFIIGVALYLMRQQYALTGRLTNYIPPTTTTTTSVAPVYTQQPVYNNPYPPAPSNRVF